MFNRINKTGMALRPWEWDMAAATIRKNSIFSAERTIEKIEKDLMKGLVVFLQQQQHPIAPRKDIIIKKLLN
jgi:hypothetical protein